MEKIIGGLSNDVFKYKNLIFKFYKNSLLQLDNNFEEQVQKKLFEKFANVPEIVQSIIADGKLIGRIEKYIESTTVTKEHFMTEWAIYAKLLVQIHSTNINQLQSPPNFFLYLEKWTQILDKQMESLEHEHTELFNNFKIIKEKADKYILELLMFANHMSMELVLCHNDFQQLNILVDSSNLYYIIDFEYASLNYLYYDIANYFAECAFDNSQLKYDNSKYPNINTRCKFYKEYFYHKHSDDYYLQIDLLVNWFVPLVEYFWYIWSLIKYTDTKSQDYLTYGQIRYLNFINLLEQKTKYK